MFWRKGKSEAAASAASAHQTVNHARKSSRDESRESAIQADRKSLISIYILCRVLMEVVKQSYDLGDDLSEKLEEIVFKQLRTADPVTINRSLIRRSNWNLFAELLGEMSSRRFLSVTDRFIADLEKFPSVIPKEKEAAADLVVRGMRYLRLTLYPMDALEESGEFLESLVKFFSRTQNASVKCAYADVFCHVLLPFAGSATAELNHPLWMSAITSLHARALELIKLRSWQTGFPLAVTSLCVAPNEFFGNHWLTLIDSSLARAKDRASRASYYSGIARLLWTFMCRCTESLNNTTKKLDHINKIVFNTSKKLWTTEVISPCVQIVRIGAYGYLQHILDNVILQLLSQDVFLENIIPERAIIAIKSFTWILYDLELEQRPPFPTDDVFQITNPLPKYKVPILTGSYKEFYTKFSTIITKLANLCDQQFGAHILPEEKQKASVQLTFHFGNDNLIQNQKSAFIDLFMVVIESVPWLSSENKILEILCRNINHPERKISDACERSLYALARARDTRSIVSVYTKFLFVSDEKLFTQSDPAPSALVDFERLLSIYVELLNIWISKIKEIAAHDPNEDLVKASWWPSVEEVEGNGLFFLCSQDRTIRHLAIKILRLTLEFDLAICENDRMSSKPHSRQPSKSIESAPSRLIQYLESEDGTTLLNKSKPVINLSVPERSRLTKLRARKKENLLRLAESDYGVDSALWFKVFPSFIQACFELFPILTAICRNIVCIRLVQMYDIIFEFSMNETIGGSPHTFMTKHPMRTHAEVLIEQWRIYLVVACSTLTLTDEQRLHVPDAHRQHGRKKSVQRITIHHQKITSVKSVFRMVIPLLGVEHTIIRDAIVTGVSCVNVNIYKTLLECLSPAIGSWNEDVRKKSPRQNSITAIKDTSRQAMAITEIVHLLTVTVHYLDTPDIAEDEAIIAQLIGLLNDLRQFLALPHVQVDYSFQQLRRYFCDLLEKVYLSVSKDKTRVNPISFESRLSFFTLVEEWCSSSMNWSLAQDREGIMKRTVLSNSRDANNNSIILASMELEKRKYDISVVKVMAALCLGPVVESKEEGKRRSNMAFNVTGLLKWIETLLEDSKEEMRSIGMDALRNLLISNPDHPSIFEETILNGYKQHTETKASASYFTAVANVLLAVPDYPCAVYQPLALGLFKTGDQDIRIRSLACDLLKATELRFYGNSCLREYRASITNKTVAVYKRAMFNLSTRFANDHAGEVYMVFSVLTKFFHTVNDISRRDILAVLLPWIQTVELQLDVNDIPSPSAAMVMNNLFEITVVFSDRIQNEVEALWVALGNGRYPGNVKAVMDFVLHHSLERRDPQFVDLSRKVLVYLAATPAGSKLIDALLGYLQPKSMIPQHPDAYDLSAAESKFPYVAQISTILPVSTKETSFSHGQLAMILLVDLLLSPQDSIKTNIHLILHVSFVLLDHYVEIVHDMARELLIHIVDEFSGYKDDAEQFCDRLRRLDSKSMWNYDDLNGNKNGARTPKEMVDMIKDVLTIFIDQMPDLREKWAHVALSWATTCPVRHIACRSFQTYRTLLFSLDQSMLADMLARLSNTISDSTPDIQGFSMQILMTLNAVTAKLDPQELINFPQLFWAAAACLTTVHEQEFIEVLSILEKFICKIDMDSPDTIAALISTFPAKWEGKFEGLQSCLIPGLRSSLAYDQTIRIHDILNRLHVNNLVGGPDRIPLAFAINVPRFLHALDKNEITVEVSTAAERIRELCDDAGLTGFSRLFSSLSKGRFRSKDDFIQQAVQALDSNFFPQFQAPVLSLLLGNLSNKIRWVKEETMIFLKPLFPVVDMQREEFAGVGADIISPLLRLLQTDYADQALDVLDSAVSIPAGKMDKHVLRMSLGNKTLRKEYEKTATLFGIPDDSGWAVPMPAVGSNITRNNVHAVFYSCSTESNTEGESDQADSFQFHKEEYGYGLDQTDRISIAEDHEAASLSHMWTALDNLDSFFTKDINKTSRRPNHDHNFSVTDTDASTDIIDPSESVPQLYDKKVSLILNRSLARTPSTTSFKTTLADSFNNPISPSESKASPRGHWMNTGAPKRREIIDYSQQITPSTSNISSYSDGEPMSPQVSSFMARSEMTSGSDSQQSHNVTTSINKTLLEAKSMPSMKQVAHQEPTFRLESLLRGNIRKAKKKDKSKEEKKEKEKEKDRAKGKSKSKIDDISGRIIPSSFSGRFTSSSLSLSTPSSPTNTDSDNLWDNTRWIQESPSQSFQFPQR